MQKEKANQKHLSQKVSASTSESVTNAERNVRSIFDAIAELMLQDNKDVVLTPLGKFEKVLKPKRNARKGRNPKTGETLDIPEMPAKYVLKFKASTDFLHALNQ